MPRLVYVTGGARSGKSAYAQRLAEGCAGALLYVATAGVHDAEMEERVRRHRLARGERWTTLEEPTDLARRIPERSRDKGAVLIDCATLWLTNLLFARDEDPQEVLGEVDRFLESVKGVEATVFVVSGEVGMGIVPENRLARLFRDLAGEANQKLAAAADEAWLVASGIPLRLK